MGDDQRLRLWQVRLEMFLRHPYGADKSLGPGTDPTADTMWELSGWRWYFKTCKA